ncbi:Imm1 family immunity protein [Saccharopolyspora sp. CA-218241]|uniref:Imm1 family immunity protein n=1 Tax=Saccharopolyspora sp. CA-218241 TaxID=3240027 RepID=UPI003D99F315
MTAVQQYVTAVLDGERRHAPADTADELIDTALATERERGAFLYVAASPFDGAVEHRPGHQMRVNVDESRRWGAISYVAEGARGGAWNTRNPAPPAATTVWFDGSTPTAFPRSAVLPLAEVREAVAEFCRTGLRPTCVRWQPGHWY